MNLVPNFVVNFVELGSAKASAVNSLWLTNYETSMPGGTTGLKAENIFASVSGL
jgi:hypothetical protein